MRTLYAKLSAVLLLLLLVVGAVTAALTVRTSRLYMQEVQQKLHRDVAAKMLQDQPSIEDSEARDEVLRQIFEKLMLINPDLEVYLLDREGRIIGYSAPPGRVQSERVSLAPVQAFLAPDARLPILGTDPRNPDAANIFSVAPIGDPPRGYLYVVLASEQLSSVASMVATSYILRTGVSLTVGSLLVALIGGLLLFRRLTRRLRRLSAEMTAFDAHLSNGGGPTVAGRDAHRAAHTGEPTEAGDEVDALERRFHAMRCRISHQLTELEARDQERRDLLANISHDVRTPLTHLQGYLETLLLKGESLSDEKRQECLQIAAQRSEQLGRLVVDLLDLARLEAPERLMEKEDFSIAELVQDVAEGFRLAAAERGIDLDVRIDAPGALIRGDLGTLERTLQNLIENAVRYTRRGDRVDVSVERDADLVQVSVRDTGPGIPPQELEHVFDRFYRCRGGGSQEGSGLGLSIARRALQLHGADLICESTVGEGTVFRFALARVPGGG